MWGAVVRFRVLSTPGLSDDHDTAAPTVIDASTPTVIAPETFKRIGIVGSMVTGTGPAKKVMGRGLSISPICQECEALSEASRSAVIEAEAEADRETLVGMSRRVWTSADMETSASRPTWPESVRGPALRSTSRSVPSDRLTPALRTARTPAVLAWKV